MGMEYKDKVKADRESRRMTQQEYADFIGVNRATINRAENGRAGAFAKLQIRAKTGIKESEE